MVVQLVTDDRLALNDELFADSDRHSASAVDVFDLAEADFRPTQIAEHRDRLGESDRRLADVQEHSPVIFEFAVREIQPADIDPAVEQLVQQSRRHYTPGPWWQRSWYESCDWR